jgi:radical SAM protein with 4Fe4S-binding SPASM domain
MNEDFRLSRRINYFPNRLRLLSAYLAGKPRIAGGPVTLAIESTAKCNLSCPMCFRARIYFQPRNMEMSVFRKIIDDGKEFLEFAVPYGAGEPLLNPQIFEMIAYCAEIGVPSGISTNATLLSEKYSRRLIESGLNQIIFAFDGATRKTYESYRKGANFDQVYKNILTFLRVKKEMRSKIFCIVQAVAFKENLNEIPDIVKMWRREGIDEVRVKNDEVHFEGNAVPGLGKHRSPLKRHCYHLWRGPMYIHNDGTFFPCCYSYPYEPIGNIKKNSIMEIWNSEKIVRMREAHLRGESWKYEVCANCSAVRLALPVILGSFLIHEYTLRKIIPFFERIAHFRNIPIFERP